MWTVTILTKKLEVTTRIWKKGKLFMTVETFNAQLKDMNDNLIMPTTPGSLVFNNSSEALGTVEEDAQVNIIESIKVNGTALDISSKEVDVEIAAHATYTIDEVEEDAGYLTAFQLKKNGTAQGTKINIPKDLFLQSAEVKACETADSPIQGLAVGDFYIDMVLANASNSHIYVDVSSLMDIYTAGTGITITNNEIAIDSTVATLGDSLSHYGITDCYTDEEMNETFGDLTYEELS